MLALAAGAPSPFWFVTRATGAVTLVLLTVTVALGIATVRRTQLAHLPRFVTDAVHRSASLCAVSFLFVHVLTTLLDGYVPITLLDVVIPFGSAYRPLWLGFGAIAFDLICAVTITSLLRRRLGYAAWRYTHWLAYASWPVALVHGLGTGTDTRTHWMLLLSAGCVVLIVLAVIMRVVAGWPNHIGLRLGALGLAGVIPLGVLAWLPRGPLGHDWARRAGTPPALLTGSSSAIRVSEVQTTPTSGGETSEHESSFRSSVTGRVRQEQLAGDQRQVDISLRAPGQVLSSLDIHIDGPATPGGGVQLATSRVSLGSSADPGQYAGQVTALDGSNIEARVSNPGHAEFTLTTHLVLAGGDGSASGTLVATAHEGAH